VVDRGVEMVVRPPLGALRFTDGRRIDLGNRILLGRRPEEVAAAIGGTRGSALDDPEKALSRVHVEVCVEDWQVLVTDQGSMNGTWVRLPERPAEQLRPHEPLVITPGTEVSLGEVVAFVFEGASS
jgi:hypothetical protein